MNKNIFHRYALKLVDQSYDQMDVNESQNSATKLRYHLSNAGNKIEKIKLITLTSTKVSNYFKDWLLTFRFGYQLAHQDVFDEFLFLKRNRRSFYKSFERLYRKSRTSDGLCNLQEDNILLRSYEKNLIRILYLMISDNVVVWHLREYFLFLKDKLDSHSKNQFLNKLKQWMNFDQLKKISKKESTYSPEQHDYINIFDATAFEKAINKEIIDALYNPAINVDGNKNTRIDEPFFLLSQFYLLEFLSKIEQSYSFLIYDRLSKRMIFAHNELRSSYFLILEKELKADIIGFLKLLHVTESWVVAVKETNVSSITKLNGVIQELKLHNTLKMPQLDENLEQTYLLVLKNLNFTSLEYINSYIECFQKIIQNSLLEKICTMTRSHKDLSDWVYFPKQHPYKDKLSFLFLDLIQYSLYKKKYRVNQIEHLQRISKNIKHTIAQDYIRLIMSVAKNPKYRNVDKSDLLQEGLIGLAKAVERFQLDRGYQFTTYATWWVHQALNRVLADYSSNIILIPTHLQRKIHLIQSTSRLLGKKLKREPLIEEVALELKIPIQKIYQFLETSTLSKRLVSLDQKVAASDSRTYQHFIKAVPPRVPVSINRLFIYLLRFLSPRDATIMRMRLGIIPYKKHTMEQVARIFSVNREKIKNIEKYSLQKIRAQLMSEGRHSSLASRLSKYLADQILFT